MFSWSRTVMQRFLRTHIRPRRPLYSHKTHLTRPASTRTFTSTSIRPSSSNDAKLFQFISQITKEAQTLAKQGVGFDINASSATDRADFINKIPDDVSQLEFTLDPVRVATLNVLAESWPRHRSLPPGWRSHFRTWDLLATFFYPTPSFYPLFILPQIDVILNVRYGLSAVVARPLLYNNATSQVIFELIPRLPRSPDPDLQNTVKENPQEERKRPRTLYLLDWDVEELYKITNAFNVAEVSDLITVARSTDEKPGGLGALELEKLTPSPEGEELIDRMMENDDTVIPLLTSDKYLGYVPAPTETMSVRYLEQSEDILGESLDDALRNAPTDASPELRDASVAARKEIDEMFKNESKNLEEGQGNGKNTDAPALLGGETQELLDALGDVAPEELAPLRDLLVAMREMDPAKYEELQKIFTDHVMELEREVEEHGKILGELLIEAKQKKQQEQVKEEQKQ